MLFNKEFKKDNFTTSDNIKINYVCGGRGEPLVLLHGYPQTHSMWADVANELSKEYFVICPDLRGYGDSSKPKGLDNHENYSKKVMANDIIELIKDLNFDEFFIAGHDRGARVTHRICLDYPHMVKKACVLDIAPTFHMFLNSDMNFSTGYYHWFFLIQEGNLPETLIGNNSEYYLKEKLKRWSAPGAVFKQEAVDEYVRCFDKDMIHATCEDYRASATIDMQDDAFSRDRKITMPLLALWGEKGFINKNYNVIDVWKDYANDITGKALDCGHFLAEEASSDVISEFRKFFK